MTEIDLLTGGFAPKKETRKLAKLVKNLFFVSFAILIILVVGMGSAFFVLNGKVTASEERQEELEATLSALSKKEQTYTLAKDRAIKARDILDTVPAETNTEYIDGLLSTFPDGLTVNLIEISDSKVVLEVTANDINSLIIAFENILSTDLYESIILDTFQFSPAGGYSFGLTFKL